MEPSKSYCQFVATLAPSNLHKVYHDTLYGFPVKTDNELFGRLILEINQAGLSWTTILNKQEHFKRAFSNFDIKKIASYNESDKNRLLNDTSIIRNKLKINAVIFNAQRVIEIQKEKGTFITWLNNHHQLKLEEWISLFKKNFKFTGKEITKEFLMSSGYLKGAHSVNCPVYKKILCTNPLWMRNSI